MSKEEARGRLCLLVRDFINVASPLLNVDEIRARVEYYGYCTLI